MAIEGFVLPDSRLSSARSSSSTDDCSTSECVCSAAVAITADQEPPAKRAKHSRHSNFFSLFAKLLDSVAENGTCTEFDILELYELERGMVVPLNRGWLPPVATLIQKWRYLQSEFLKAMRYSRFGPIVGQYYREMVIHSGDAEKMLAAGITLTVSTTLNGLLAVHADRVVKKGEVIGYYFGWLMMEEEFQTLGFPMPFGTQLKLPCYKADGSIEDKRMDYVLVGLPYTCVMAQLNCAAKGKANVKICPASAEKCVEQPPSLNKDGTLKRAGRVSCLAAPVRAQRDICAGSECTAYYGTSFWRMRRDFEHCEECMERDSYEDDPLMLCEADTCRAAMHLSCSEYATEPDHYYCPLHDHS